jgi:MATE family multidrug resistance protein
VPAPRLHLPTRAELVETLRLAVPVVTVQVGLMLMGVVDTMFVGRVSPAAIGATALGNLAFVTVTMPALGTLMALDPIVAQAVGARDAAAVRHGIQRGLVLAALLALPCSLLLLFVEPAFVAARQPAELIPLAVGYVRRCIPGVWPFLAFVALRQSLQALGRVRAIVVVIMLANLANALLDWVLIYGKSGAPALGVDGAAWASTICRWGMAVGLLAAGWPALAPQLTGGWAGAWARRPLLDMARIGLPIGLQLELELSAFGAVALLMGRLGTTAMAAHQVAINLASLTFMVPLGVGAAAAVLVGRAVGAGDAAGARQAAATTTLLGTGFMCLTAVVFTVLPGPLTYLYTTDVAVLAVTVVLLPIAGVFQIFDGLQAVLAGVLRGAGDTHAAMRANLVGFWVVGMPISLLAGFVWGGGPAGLWWGLVAGLVAVSALLGRRAARRLGRPADVLTGGPARATVSEA